MVEAGVDELPAPNGEEVEDVAAAAAAPKIEAVVDFGCWPPNAEVDALEVTALLPNKDVPPLEVVAAPNIDVLVVLEAPNIEPPEVVEVVVVPNTLFVDEAAVDVAANGLLAAAELVGVDPKIDFEAVVDVAVPKADVVVVVLVAEVVTAPNADEAEVDLAKLPNGLALEVVDGLDPKIDVVPEELVAAPPKIAGLDAEEDAPPKTLVPDVGAIDADPKALFVAVVDAAVVTAVADVVVPVDGVAADVLGADENEKAGFDATAVDVLGAVVDEGFVVEAENVVAVDDPNTDGVVELVPRPPKTDDELGVF